MRGFRYQATGVAVLVATMGMTSPTALASSTLTRPGTAESAAASARTSQQHGNVELLVPPAVISSSDGLGTLITGATYHLVVPVWLAAGQPQTNARIDLVGAQVTRCGRTRLMAGAITRLQCRVVPIASGQPNGLVVTVVVDVHEAPSVVATFTHRVQAYTTS